MVEREKLVLEPEFGQQVDGRRMDGVAAKVPQEVAVFFEHDNLDPGSGEQETEEQPSRAAADDAALRVERPGAHHPIVGVEHASVHCPGV